MDLSTVKAREKLKPQREPYWHKIASGQFLGFRPSRVGNGGAWIARYYDAEERTQKYHAFGDFGHLPQNERFSVAQKEAREWFEHVGAGGSHKPITVQEVCERFARTRPEAAARFTRYVYADPIAKISLHKLTDKQLRGWRSRLESKPALVSRRKKGKPVTRARSPATLNRDMAPLHAALNLALEEGDALTARAWRKALKPAELKSRRRNLYLDRKQRLALLEHMPKHAAAFVRGLCMLPLRPGALAGMRVGDFDARNRELVIGVDKAGEGRRLLLPPETAAFFKDQTRSKLPAAPLFARANGKPWSKEYWKGPINDAVVLAGLPAGSTAYTLRHSTITDLVTSGLDLMTVAQVSGTSVAMIEKHYAHLQRDRAAEALAGLAL